MFLKIIVVEIIDCTEDYRSEPASGQRNHSTLCLVFLYDILGLTLMKSLLIFHRYETSSGNLSVLNSDFSTFVCRQWYTAAIYFL